MFDVTRKTTYQNLATWYQELRDSAGKIPCILVANKIDINYKVVLHNQANSRSARTRQDADVSHMRACVLLVSHQVTSKKFKFADTHNLPFFFVSAADGTNVVRVS